MSSPLQALEEQLRPGERVLWSGSAWPGLGAFVRARRGLVVAACVGIALMGVEWTSWWIPWDEVSWSTRLRQLSVTLAVLCVLVGPVVTALRLRGTQGWITSERVAVVTPSTAVWSFRQEPPQREQRVDGWVLRWEKGPGWRWRSGRVTEERVVVEIEVRESERAAVEEALEARRAQEA